MTIKRFSLLSVTLGLVLGLGACGGSSNACDDLAKKLCAGKDAATCKKTKEWLDSEMTGPDGKKLSSAESGAACKMIMSDKDALSAYQDMANEKTK